MSQRRGVRDGVTFHIKPEEMLDSAQKYRPLVTRAPQMEGTGVIVQEGTPKMYIADERDQADEWEPIYKAPFKGSTVEEVVLQRRAFPDKYVTVLCVSSPMPLLLTKYFFTECL